MYAATEVPVTGHSYLPYHACMDQSRSGVSWTQLAVYLEGKPDASRRVVPRRGNPPSLYIETAGFFVLSESYLGSCKGPESASMKKPRFVGDFSVVLQLAGL